MADMSHALFYNSDNGDRVYDADSFEHLLKKFFTTGVFQGSCQGSAPGTGMIVRLGTGYCNIDGKVRFFNEQQEFLLQNAHATYDRIDTIVIERNDIDRDITAKVITGTYSASPRATAPVREGGIYQLVVAEVYVAGGVVKVTNSNITDRRPNTSVCGYVLSAVQTPDFSELYTQFQTQAAEFMSQTQTGMASWTSGFEQDAEAWKSDFEDDAETWQTGFEQTSESWKTSFQQAATTWKSDFISAMEAWETTFEGTAQSWYQIRTSEFSAWFQNLQDMLDDNQAAHLQGEIDDITGAFRKIGIEIVNGQFYISPVEYIE